MPTISRDHLLVIAKLRADGPDPGYMVYCEAYGLEMQYDPDWPVTLVLLAPPEHLRQVTVNTDVRSLGIRTGLSSVTANFAPASLEVDWVFTGSADLGRSLAAGYQCVVLAGTDLSALTTEERARIAVVVSADEVVRTRQSFPEATVLLAGGSAEDCRVVGADGVYLDGYFGQVLEVCKEFARAQENRATDSPD